MAYFIQFEDKSLGENTSLATLAGVKANFSSLTNIVLTNHASDLHDKYANSGVKTVLYQDENFTVRDLAQTAEFLFNLLKNSNDTYIFEDSKLGNLVAARLAAKLAVPFIPSISNIKVGPNSVSLSREIDSTKVVRLSHLKGKGVISVAINGVVEKAKAEVSEKPMTISAEEPATYEEKRDAGNDLLFAKTVVAGGKGLQDAEGFKPLEQLADKLDASVGATKAVTDVGWLPVSRMIGISGVSVKPDIFYSFGIAGAVQHTTGMDQSKHIIAVNTDPTAPIFKLADYGIVGDANQVIDQLINLV